MSGVSRVSSAPGATAGESTPGAATSSLMPGPGAGALAGTDPLSMLYLLESKDSQDGATRGAGKIKGLEAERGRALQKEENSIRQQDEAAKDHNFLDQVAGACGEVAKVAGVVGSIAAAMGTAGAATPLAAVAIAGAVLSTAGFADGELHVLQKLGVDDRTAGLMDLGLSLGGVGCGVGAGLAAGGQAATQATEIVGRTAAVVTGVATVGKGVSEIESGQALASLDRARADQIAAQAQTDDLQRAVQHVIAGVQDADERSRRITSTIAGIKTLQNQTLTLAASGVKG